MKRYYSTSPLTYSSTCGSAGCDNGRTRTDAARSRYADGAAHYNYPVWRKQVATCFRKERLECCGDNRAACCCSAIDTAALNEVENDVDQLTSRAASIDTGLANLQRQQAAAGYGLRGDMAEKQAAMRLNIAKAQDAVRSKDVDRAKKYAATATANIEALEKFLGR